MAKTEKKNNSIDILIVSPHQNLEALISGRLKKFGYSIRAANDLNEVLTSDSDNVPSICIIDGNMQHTDTAENILSVLRDEHPETHCVVAYSGKLEAQSEILYRSGAKNIYQIPFEEELLINEIFAQIPIEISDKLLDISVMSKISISDFLDCETYPFDTYVILPINKKVLLYQKKNSKVESDTVKKIKDKNLQLYIRKSEMDKYHKFIADKITGGNVSAEMKQYSQSVRKEMKRFMNKVFSNSELTPEDQVVMLDTMKKVTLQLMENLNGGNKFLSRLSALTSESFSNFSHSTNVATYSAMFSMIAGFNDIEELFLGGLLHDIGHSESKSGYQNNLEEDRKHTELGISILERKGVEISENVKAMILQHHEHPDGSGFPLGLKSDDIHSHAKVCALADYFDLATSLTSGKGRMSTEEALIEFSGQGITGKAHPSFDAGFHQPIIDAILISEEVTEEKVEAQTEDTVTEEFANELESDDEEHEYEEYEEEDDSAEEGAQLSEAELLAMMMSNDSEEEKSEEEQLLEAYENFKPDDEAA